MADEEVIVIEMKFKISLSFSSLFDIPDLTIRKHCKIFAEDQEIYRQQSETLQQTNKEKYILQNGAIRSE